MIDRVKNEPSDDVRDDPLENLFPIHPQNPRRAFNKSNVLVTPENSKKPDISRSRPRRRDHQRSRVN
jgi:hypothetical protein